MSSWICVEQRVISDICIRVQRLRIRSAGNDRVRTDKPIQRRVIISSAIKIESGAIIKLLSGVFMMSIDRPLLHAGLPKGEIRKVLHPLSDHINNRIAAPQVIRMVVVVQVATNYPYCDPLFSREDIFEALTTCALVQFADVDGYRRAYDLHYAAAITVVDKARRACRCRDADRSIFWIIGDRSTCPAEHV